MGRFIRITLALLAWTATGLYAGKKVMVGPAPKWVTPTEFRIPAFDSVAAGDGTDYLLVDNQTHAGEETEYSHFVTQITSQAGLQSESQIRLSFNPSYQTLTIHSIRLWRDGHAIDELDVDRIHVIQREQSLDYDLYDGRLTAVRVFDDLRVGDVIEYASSLRGKNPIFKGHFYDSNRLGWSVPIGRIKYRVLIPSSKIVYVKTHGGAADPVTTTSNGFKEYLWEKTGLDRTVREDNAPEWYNPYAYAEISDFTDWKSVADWAKTLFRVADDLSPELMREVEKIDGKHQTPEEKTIATLRFVQDDIRYFGYELGENSHRPNGPNKVYAQRFGDCKDKALLMCAMLQRMKIHAVPALTNSSARHTVAEWLPSGEAFDHCVVGVRLEEGESRFFDPTDSYQGGDFSSTYFPEGLKLLALDEAAESLTTSKHIALPPVTVDESEVFSVPNFTDSVGLTIRTIYRSVAADNMRSYLAGKERADVDRDFVKYYTKQYNKIRTASSVEVEDIRTSNVLTLRESYVIDDFWEPSTDTAKLVGSFYSQSVRDRIARPAGARRTSPLAISYPVSISCDIRADLPKQWKIADSEKRVTDNAFTFYTKAEWKESALLLKYALSTSRSYLDPEDYAAHVQNVDIALKNVGYTLYQFKESTSTYPPWIFALLGGFMALSVYVVRRALAESEVVRLPGGSMTSPEVSGMDAVSPPPPAITGWLILPGLTLIVNPLRTLISLYNTYDTLFSNGSWNAVTTPGTARYVPMYAPLILFELIGNLGIVLFGVVVAIYFFRKRRETKWMFVAYLICMFMLVAMDDALNYFTLSMVTRGFYEIFRTLLFAGVWIYYFRTSRRVRETFVL